MKNITLDDKQIKELADYAAKRSASNSTRAGEQEKLIDLLKSIRKNMIRHTLQLNHLIK